MNIPLRNADDYEGQQREEEHHEDSHECKCNRAPSFLKDEELHMFHLWVLGHYDLLRFPSDL